MAEAARTWNGDRVVGWRRSLFPRMNLPNLLSLARIIMVPILVVVLMTKETNH